MRPTLLSGLVLLGMASPLHAQEIVQVTNGHGEHSNVGEIGGPKIPFVPIESTGDLTPSVPGNADGSKEIFLYDLRTGALRQITNYAGPDGLDTSTIATLENGTLVLSSQADLTPNAPGHDTQDRNSFAYLYYPARKGSPASLVQVAPRNLDADGLSPIFAFDKDRSVLFISTLDPLGGNPDNSTEVFLYDRGTSTLRALSAGAGDTFPLLPMDANRKLLLQSRSDLTGTGSNADGSEEIFLKNLVDGTVEQITNEVAEIDWDYSLALDPTGRFSILQRRDSTGAGTVTEMWSVDFRKRKFTKISTETNGSTNELRGMLPGTKTLVLNTRSDLVPQSLTAPGNADGSLEVFTFDLRSGRFLQRTTSDTDVTVRRVPKVKRRPLILTSRGDLTPNAPGNPLGVTQVYLLDVGPKLLPAVQVTNSDRDCTVSGFNEKGDMVAITSRGDLVPASSSTPGNAGHVQHVFLLSLKGTPTLRQMTVGDQDVTFKGFLYDGRSFLVQTTYDLVPNNPGNPDGGTEVYRIFYR